MQTPQMTEEDFRQEMLGLTNAELVNRLIYWSGMSALWSNHERIKPYVAVQIIKPLLLERLDAKHPYRSAQPVS